MAWACAEVSTKSFFTANFLIFQMQQLTPTGQNIIEDIAQRYNLSKDSAINMLVAVNRGGGSMAQFSCPELGSGQWMRGGMTMVGDMFNHGLKNTVNNLCGELSSALANNQMFPAGKNGGGNNWWPGDLGSPSSSGSQNNVKYAFFPQTQRLAVERNGEVTLFNTLNHNISGVSQQQGGSSSLTFSSQFGTISTLNLPMISGPGLLPENSSYQGQTQGSGDNSTNFAEPISRQNAPADESKSSAQDNSQGGSDPERVMGLIGNLGKLKEQGLITDEEFQQKKTELLKRL